jgi:hypothetical protein
MAASLRIVGADRLQRKLRRIKPRRQKRLYANALRAGGRIIAKEAKSRAPRLTGLFGDKIKVKALRVRRAGEVAATIVHSAAPHDHLVQLGTGERRQTSTGRSAGKMPANPVVADAAARKRGVVEAKVTSNLATGIERELAR